ncbi:MAG: alpha-amylase family glycosyl hydrolase [Bacteroidia bacterium]|nr:alpha-amylase family glycosyl hydrolase [Bacteroidia bacterium]
MLRKNGPIFLLLISIQFLYYPLHAQIISIDPVFPTMDDTITVVYDATQGSAGLLGVNQVYAHAGLITDQSTSPSDWKYVQGNWGTDDPKVKMTFLGNNKHELKYHARTFYGVPANENVQRLSFVFRNVNGSREGKTSTGGDIFYDVFDASTFNVALLAPQGASIIEPSESLSVRFATSANSSLSLYKNGALVTQVTGREINYTIQESVAGDYWFRVEADNGSQVKMDSFFVSVREAVQTVNPPANTLSGVNYLDDSTVILSLVAPSKNYVHLIGEFNNWTPSNASQMKRASDGNSWWIQLNGLSPGEEYAYQFMIDGDLKVADPYAHKVLDPWNDSFIPSSTYPNLKAFPSEADGIVSVLQTAQTPFSWQNNSWQATANEDLVIYELLVRDFLAQSDFQTLLDTLDYLENLGVNAIEFMPTTEFEANDSWGYNPSFMFAVDKYYGPADALKAFIDECHARNIVVILDMVLNHQFGQSPLVQMYWDGANNRPAANSPWFNPIAKHPFNVGYDMDHASTFTQDFVDDVLDYWVEEFRFDGYRMDLSKGFTQTDYGDNVGAWSSYDQGRINIIKRMYDQLQAKHPGSYFILEHFADNLEERELADYGMMLWGNLGHAYNEATMGYHDNNKSNFDWISYQQRGYNDPHVIGYMESHDEERLMYKNITFGNVNGNYSTKDLNTALERMEMAATFFFPVPGPKLLWQFGELGYEVSIDQGGRLGRKPIRWNYYNQVPRRRLFEIYSALIKLKQEHEVFRTRNFSLNVASEFKRINLDHPSMNVTIIGNFGVQTRSGNANFQNTGWWYDYFTGDSIEVTQTNASINLQAGEYHLYTDQRLETPPVNVSSRDIELDLSLDIYPNPAQDQISIDFLWEDKGTLTLEMMDMTGRKISSLLENELLLPGPQSLNWTRPEGLNAGLYILRFVSERGVASRKVILE